jgi:hypothetical protein
VALGGRRRPALPAWLLVGTVGLAGALALIVYLAVTSLPYLASSPSTDPTFGALDACVLGALEQRTGFAVSRDAARVAAWSPDRLVECGPGDVAPRRAWPKPGITLGAYDGEGTLWLAQRASGTTDAGEARRDPPRLWAWRDGVSPAAVAELEVQGLAGTARGVVVLEASGQVSALDTSGAVAGSVALPTTDVRGAALGASGDGERVAVVVAGGVYVLGADAALRRAEAPCAVDFAWWLPGGHRALLACRPPGSLYLSVDLDSGRAEAAPRRARVHSSLVGPAGPWVERCDVLPCTAPPPE